MCHASRRIAVFLICLLCVLGLRLRIGGAASSQQPASPQKQGSSQQQKPSIPTPDPQLIARIQQAREEWRNLSKQAQQTRYPKDSDRADTSNRLLQANQNLQAAETAAQRGDKNTAERQLSLAQGQFVTVTQHLRQYSAEANSPQILSKEVLTETAKTMAISLAPGNEFVAGADVTANLLNISPAIMANKWNTMFAVANSGWGDPPQIDQRWALTPCHKTHMIALYIALNGVQRKLEGNNTKVMPVHFPEYKQVINRAYQKWPKCG